VIVVEGQDLAIISIYQAQALYNTALDDGDFDKVGQAFAEDGVMVATSGATWAGRDSICNALRARRQARDLGQRTGTFHRHNLTTRRIEFTGPDTATGLCYYIVTSELGLDHCGRYFDAYSRIGPSWFIQSRRSQIEWMNPNSRFSVQGAPISPAGLSA
jgi:uncharacterized protein (TIGR02246 family)